MLTYTIKDILNNIDKIQAGDSLLVNDKRNIFQAPTAFIIKIATEGPFNHVGMLSFKEGKLNIVEADTKDGVIETSIDKYDRDFIEVLILRPLQLKDGKRYTKANGQSSVERARTKIGLKYDFFGLLGFGFEVFGNAIIKKIFKKWNPTHWRNRFFCSELVVESYREANVDVCKGTTPSSASPNDIFRDLTNGMKLVTLDDNEEMVKMYKENRYEMLKSIKK